MVQFLTNRVSDTTYLKDVDDRYQDLEDAVVYFFGLTVDEVLLGRVMTSDVDGNITSMIRQAASGGTDGPAWRFRDTTNDDEVLIVSEDGYLRIYENTGTEESPLWTERNKIKLSNGVMDVISEDEIGTGCHVYDPDIEDYSGAGAFMPFQYEAYDDGAYFTVGTSATKLVVPNAGRYRVNWGAAIGISGAHYYNVEIFTALYLNGSPVADSWVGTGTIEEIDVSGPPVWPPFGISQNFALDGLSADDYLEFHYELDSFGDNATYLNFGYATIERTG